MAHSGGGGARAEKVQGELGTSDWVRKQVNAKNKKMKACHKDTGAAGRSSHSPNY